MFNLLLLLLPPCSWTDSAEDDLPATPRGSQVSSFSPPFSESITQTNVKSSTVWSLFCSFDSAYLNQLPLTWLSHVPRLMWCEDRDEAALALDFDLETPQYTMKSLKQKCLTLDENLPKVITNYHARLNCYRWNPGTDITIVHSLQSWLLFTWVPTYYESETAG